MARRKMKYKTKRKLNGFLYTLPWLIGFVMFFAVPISIPLSILLMMSELRMKVV